MGTEAEGKKGSLVKDKHCPFLWQSQFVKPNRGIFEESTMVPVGERSRRKHLPGPESEKAPSVVTSTIKFPVPPITSFPSMDVIRRERQESQAQFFWGKWSTHRRPRQGKRKSLKIQ